MLKLLTGEFSFLNLKAFGKLGSKFLLTVDLKSIIEIESMHDYGKSLSKNEKIFENNYYFLIPFEISHQCQNGQFYDLNKSQNNCLIIIV